MFDEQKTHLPTYDSFSPNTPNADGLAQDLFSHILSVAASISTLRYLAVTPSHMTEPVKGYEWWRITRSSNDSTPRLDLISTSQGSALLTRLYTMDRDSLLRLDPDTIDTWISLQ